MKYNLLKKLIREEVERLKEQNMDMAPVSQMGMAPQGEEMPDMDVLNNILYSALGDPTTPDEIILGYQKLYRKDRRKVPKMPSPNTVEAMVRKHYAGIRGQGPVTPKALPALGPLLWRAGWFAAGYLYGAIFGGDNVM
tara:strand:- start:45 stop:458 length:414 start_codon:yes stop_codon:yes gene_type:complete